MTRPSGSLETLLIHGDARDDSAVAPAIYPSSTFSARDAAHFAELATAERPERFYSRYGNPTVARCESLIATLEGCESALLLASGMGAIATTVLSFVEQGSHVVAQTSHYMGTLKLLSKLLPKWGVTVTLVDQRDPAAFEAALRPETRLVLLETPSNPTLTLTDLAAVVEIAHRRGILCIADNTFASPINQQPASLGVDLVVHSATKYLGGHNDLVAGVVCGRAADLATIWEHAIVLGASSNSFDAYLLLRGLRTLQLRVERQSATALEIARWLEARAGVARVHYPGLDSHPQRTLAQRQMRAGGGVLSFELAGGYAAARDCVARMKLVTQAVSLGGVETLAIHAASVWEGSLTPEQIAASGVPPGLIRLAVGLESPADLIADLDQALPR